MRGREGEGETREGEGETICYLERESEMVDTVESEREREGEKC